MKKMSKEETLKSVQNLRSAFELINNYFDNYFEENKMKKNPNNLFTEICSLTLFCIALPVIGIFIAIASLLTLFTIPLVVIYAYVQKLYSIYYLKKKLL